jgi:uncharacterized membrane protein
MNSVVLSKKRITSIDFLRGTVMIIMALDHVRDYFHADAFLFDPTDLQQTNVAIFFTRWITHYCAPVFMFLAGTSAFLIGQRKTKKELSAFLFKRGLWLILLELVVMNFGWNFNITFPTILLITLWALGVSMIALSVFVHLPFKAILVIGIIIVAGHNLLDTIHVPGNTFPAFLWGVLHEQEFFTWGREMVLTGYPVLPWIGVMALGYCLGALYTPACDAQKRKKTLLLIGWSAIGLFILLRFSNMYGDLHPWAAQKNPFFTFLSFLNNTKYPPSLLFILMTLGPSVLFLAFTEKAKGPIVNIVSVYGRVPLFYYVIHVYTVHLLTLLASQFFTVYGWRKWILDQPLWFDKELKGYGFSLTVVYLVWIGIVVGLYPLCKWYDRYKQSHKEKWWLSYL